MNNNGTNLTYKVSGEIRRIRISESGENNHFSYQVEKNKDKYKISISPKCEIELIKAYFIIPHNFNNEDKVFANGFQSWTDSKEFSVNEKLKSLNRVPKFLDKKYAFGSYGDYHFKKYTDRKGMFHGYSYGYIRDNEGINLIGSLSEKFGYTIINYFMPTSRIIVEKDCEGFVTDKPFELFDLCYLSGTEDEVFDKYFDLMQIEPPKVKPMSGYTSWYNHYQNISEDIITKNLDAVINYKKKLDVFQIDDGYQTAVGDWLSMDENKFPNGLKGIVKKSKDNGLLPGLWLAPFVCEKISNIYKNHNDWILKDDKGELVKAGNNWSQFYTLDIYNPEVREYIKNCFDVILNDWGFEMVKLDFLYAVSIVPNHGKSRGQIMCEAMDFIRECVGDKLILGCGVPLAPSFGKVDFCRIGCDIGLTFDENIIMRRFHRERISTKNSMYNAIYRRHLDNRAFLNDPDVFLLRDDNIKLTKKQKKNLTIVNSFFGSLLFTSDNVAEYDDEKAEIFDAALSRVDIKVKDVKETSRGNFVFTYMDGDNKKQVSINVFEK